MIDYFFDGRNIVKLDISFNVNKDASCKLSKFIRDFALEIQASHLYILLKTCEEIEKMSTRKLSPKEINAIEKALVYYSDVDHKTYKRFKEHMSQGQL